ncbi:hypothetical protein QSX22_004007 [Salmonella enterica]|nr:hypothetical protein [Salmonella enterica]
MTTITREEVKAFIEQIESDLANEWEAQIFELKLARIALASLDAKPIYQYQSGIYNDDNGKTDWYWGDCDAGFYKQYAADRRRIVYTAQPAPVVPEEMPKGLAGKIVSLLAHNIGDKFLAQKIWNACRAAMLNGGKS